MKVILRAADGVPHELRASLPGIQASGSAEVSVKVPQDALKSGSQFELKITTPGKGSQPLVTRTKMDSPVRP